MTVFDLSTHTPSQRAVVDAALRLCDFDFDGLRPGLLAATGRTSIPVTWEDLSGYGARASTGVTAITDPRHHDRHDQHDGHGHGGARRAVLGLAYYSGRIVLHDRLVEDPALAVEVFLSEAAHMVDFFALTAEQRGAVYDLMHEPGQGPHDGHGWFEESGNFDYHSWAGESWMTAFIWAFTPLRPAWGPMVHQLTEDEARQVRALIGAKPEPAPPVPDPFFAARWSVAFHQTGHWWVRRHRTFPTREAAFAAGLRACRICRP